MLYRTIIIGIDNDFSYLTVKNSGNWIDFQHRSYRKDKKANFQLIDKEGTVKGIVEAFYFEGIAAPISSNMKETDITAQVFKEVHGSEFAEPQTSFWNRLFRRN
jgi:hypothetical protein